MNFRVNRKCKHLLVVIASKLPRVKLQFSKKEGFCLKYPVQTGNDKAKRTSLTSTQCTPEIIKPSETILVRQLPGTWYFPWIPTLSLLLFLWICRYQKRLSFICILVSNLYWKSPPPLNCNAPKWTYLLQHFQWAYEWTLPTYFNVCFS